MLRPNWSLPLKWLGELCEARDPDAAQEYCAQARALEDGEEDQLKIPSTAIAADSGANSHGMDWPAR